MILAEYFAESHVAVGHADRPTGGLAEGKMILAEYFARSHVAVGHADRREVYLK